MDELRASRDDNGAYLISWEPSFSTDPVVVYAGTSPLTIDMSQALRCANVSPVTITGLDPLRRYYFYVEAQGQGGRTIAERQVKCAGAVNFRDLGGYLTADDRRVCWGRLFRAGHMSRLTANGKKAFAHLQLDRICDFRLHIERATETIELPNDPRIEVLEIPPGLHTDGYFERVFQEASGSQDVAAAIRAVMRFMVCEAAPRFRPLFEVLLDSAAPSVIMNCSAGKERTGVASALVLSALGVARETIYYDFMLSQEYFPIATEIPRVIEKYAVRNDNVAPEELVMPLLETRRSYLEAAFDYIDENYGDTECFLREHYDLNPAKMAQLRDRYTA